jgi:hypothetical protein
VRRLLAATALVAALGLTTAPGAPGAIEVGDNCVANNSLANWTAVALTREGSTIPLAVPSAGVITVWKVNVGPEESLYQQRLRVYRETRVTPYEFTTVIESEAENVALGPNSFSTRIPVKAGDRLGLFGPVQTFLCDHETADTAARFEAAAPVGTTNTFSFENDIGVPVTAIVEPDADGDGYGDETQDGCPAAPTVQTSCPVVRLFRKAVVRKRAILVQARVTSEAKVQVFGQVSWKVRQKDGSKNGLIAGLSAGGPRDVAAGTTAIFRVPLTKPVKRRLGRLGPNEALRAKMTARVTDLGARVTDHRFQVTLKGRG